MPRIDLPDGHHADLRKVEHVPERLRRPVTQALMRVASSGVGQVVSEGMTEEEAARAAASLDTDVITPMSDLNDRVVLAMVSAWSLDVPVEIGPLLDLPGNIYDSLREQCAPFMNDLMPDFTANADPESPTDPSDG